MWCLKSALNIKEQSDITVIQTLGKEYGKWTKENSAD